MPTKLNFHNKTTTPALSQDTVTYFKEHLEVLFLDSNQLTEFTGYHGSSSRCIDQD